MKRDRIGRARRTGSRGGLGRIPLNKRRKMWGYIKIVYIILISKCLQWIQRSRCKRNRVGKRREWEKGRWEIAWDEAEQGDADECLMPVFFVRFSLARILWWCREEFLMFLIFFFCFFVGMWCYFPIFAHRKSFRFWETFLLSWVKKFPVFVNFLWFMNVFCWPCGRYALYMKDKN